MQKKITPRKASKPAQTKAAETPALKAAPQRKKAAKRTKAKIYFGLHQLHPAPGSHKKKRILGRGTSSGHGKTSTRGSKGQTSRAGRHFYLGFEGGQTPLIRRIPKRGFNNPFKKIYQIVNLSDLGRTKETNLTLETLEAKGLIKDKAKLVKILGDGEIKAAVSVQAHACSKSAADKITAAGGKIELLNV
jgi:large subunit ribosomal protein L15